MQNPVDEPRTLHMRSTIDKLSRALVVNAVANALVAAATVAVALILIIDMLARS